MVKAKTLYYLEKDSVDFSYGYPYEIISWVNDQMIRVINDGGEEHVIARHNFGTVKPRERTYNDIKEGDEVYWILRNSPVFTFGKTYHVHHANESQVFVSVDSRHKHWVNKNAFSFTDPTIDKDKGEGKLGGVTEKKKPEIVKVYAVTIINTETGEGQKETEYTFNPDKFMGREPQRIWRSSNESVVVATSGNKLYTFRRTEYTIDDLVKSLMGGSGVTG